MRALPWSLLICLAATIYSTGVIWFMQVVEYPLFGFVGSQEFAAFHNRHNQGLPLVVFPLIFVAFGSSLFLLRRPPVGVPPALVWAVVGLNLLIIVSTVALQAPMHNTLDQGGFSLTVIQRLVQTNWIRTIAWTINALLLLWMAAQEMRVPAQV